ncbi:MAG: sigma-54-dependent Fis family transcriptional regulator [Deltaproteobacteria bacterium]|nr:MAG: sigma-54-dependent Fis family transcriptional regulator [Deltaproteobacteria bacterium]
MPRFSLLIIDDELHLLRSLSHLLSTKDLEVTTVENGEKAIQLLPDKSFDIVLCDICLPGKNGIDVLKEIKQTSPETVVIMMTAHATVDTTIQALRLGASDYILKPFEPEEITFVIDKAVEAKMLKEENILLRKELQEKYDFSNIIGESSSLRDIFENLKKVIDTGSTVLISGESGSGKELIARAIHYNSSRRANPFVTINCGAIPPQLMESEFFGHVKGAFTGAHSNKKGLFAQAHGGTLFLDEIGELNFDLQVKLLRALEEKKITRVGDIVPVEVDVRFIAATNKNLKEEVRRGNFREDLFYRINVLPIHLPPLRDREEDIPLLADYFLGKYCKNYNRKRKNLSPDALMVLRQYQWPGNVRELENVIERVVLMIEKDTIAPEDLPFDLKAIVPGIILRIPEEEIELKKVSHLVIELTEKQMIEKALKNAGNNKTKAAQSLGISRRSLNYKIKEYKIK